MTKEEFKEYHLYCINQMHDILQAKNEDYCSSSSPFGNFIQCELLGLCSLETGILTRISDKLARIISFTKRGILNVKDESVEDTILDAANYLLILGAYFKHLKSLKVVTHGEKEIP